MEAFEEKLRHHFRDRALLKTALTHSSFANESRAAGCESNERLAVSYTHLMLPTILLV